MPRRAQYFQHQQIIQRAAQTLGADPIAVRDVFGAIDFADPSVSAAFEAYFDSGTGAFGDDEPAPADTLAAPYIQRALDFAFLRGHSAARLYIEFQTAGVPSAVDAGGTVTITPWRVQRNGALVRGVPVTNVTHRVEIRDAEVAGRVTLYQITAIAAAGAEDGLQIHVAGEGTGYDTAP